MPTSWVPVQKWWTSQRGNLVSVCKPWAFFSFSFCVCTFAWIEAWMIFVTAANMEEKQLPHLHLGKQWMLVFLRKVWSNMLIRTVFAFHTWTSRTVFVKTVSEWWEHTAVSGWFLSIVLVNVLSWFTFAGSAPVTDSSSPAQQLLTRAADLVALEKQATEVDVSCTQYCSFFPSFFYHVFF